ncbi:hypothetical protein [Geothrix mesophila]|uniref:hypothetical protein n=1 Tax=Geothrix mesophila TaxID=2922723 RepID=UPI001FACDFA3|nr:hypothetical protein [Geothrix sp. SG198]
MEPSSSPALPPPAALPAPGFDPAARAFRLAAGFLALGYVAVQGFQDYVFAVFQAPANAAEELLQGAAGLHLARSALMLVWMFALIFIAWVICARGMRRRPILAWAAFFGFFMFGLFEVALRSVELFWTQIQLPAEYLKATEPAVRAGILDKVATFQSVQHALYFPLMLAPCLGSLGVYFLFPGSPRIHWALKAVMAIAVARMTVRLLTYADIQLMSMAFYEKIYFPLVVIEHLPKAYWLFRVEDADA